MQVGPFWCITTGTLIGPWHVASLNDGGGRAGSWYIVNVDTKQSKRIGPVRMKGKNWHDEAMDVARERNEKYLRGLDPEILPTMIGKSDRLDQAIGKILKERT